eukprot:TRINITY_DN5294_c0_g2_i1.p1 TRINITY_DN5294_c0_g2~~TRINITY_DN5294_c0_g2_i1.p1  ORF type:complete len:510 (+),score=100.16 TRINITY_DN5294_c0_g2_i1:66-1595(+)
MQNTKNVNVSTESSAGSSVATESTGRRLRRGLSVLEDEISTLIEPTKKATPDKPIHVMSIVFNLLQTTMGVGILSLAATFQFAGVVGGGVMFVIAAVLAYISMDLLLTGLVLTRSQSFESLGYNCYGKWGKGAVQVLMIIVSLVALTCFLVPLKGFIHDMLKQFMSDSSFSSFEDHGGSSDMCLLIALFLVIIPLSLLKRIDGLWFTSLLGVFFVFYFVIVSVVYMFQNDDTHLGDRVCHEMKQNNDTPYSPQEDIHLFGQHASEFFEAISIIACSFCCQMTVFPIYREVRVADAEMPAVKKVRTSALISMIIACITYILAAGSGYVIWRDLCPKPSSILTCYDPGDPQITLVYLGMTCVMMFAFPLVLFSMRYSVSTILYGEDECSELSNTVHVVLTLVLIAPVATVALVTDQLTVVIAFGGAFAAPGLCFILPGSLNYKAIKMAREQGDDGEDDDLLEGGVEDGLGGQITSREQLRNSSMLPGILMFSFGIVIQILCLIGAFYSVFG